MSDSDWQPIGQHRFRIEGDTLLWTPGGEISPVEGDLISDQMVALSARHGYALILINGHDSPPLRYEVRRLYVDKIKRHRIRLSVAVYGSRPASRVVSSLILNAARLLSKLDIDIRFPATESDARAFLDAERTRLQSAG